MKKLTKIIQYKKWINKCLQFFVYLLVSSLLVTTALLHIPWVQNRLLRQVLQHLSSTTPYTITYQQFYLAGLQYVSLQGLTIQDQQQQNQLAVADLRCKINPIALLCQRTLTIDALRIQGLQAHLSPTPASPLWLQHLQTLYTPSGRPWRLKSTSFLLQDTTLWLPSELLGLPYHTPCHIDQVSGKTLHVQDHAWTLEHITFTQATCQAWVVTQACMGLSITPTQLQCTGLQLQTKQSRLQGTLTCTYPNWAAWTHFADDVHLAASLEDVTLAAEELTPWIPALPPAAVYRFSGQGQGTVQDFVFENCTARIGNSTLQGSLSLQGILSTVHGSVQLQASTWHAADLKPYISEIHYQQLAPLGLCTVQGSLTGGLTDFVIQGTLASAVGSISADMHMTTAGSLATTTYQGTVTTQDWALGTWTSAGPTVSMQVALAGKGIGWAVAAGQLQATIHTLAYPHYTYTQLTAVGKYTPGTFHGNLTAHDPQLTGRAQVHYTQGTLSLQGHIEKAILPGLTHLPITVRTQLALTLPYPWGENTHTLCLQQIEVQQDDTCFPIDQLLIQYTQNAGHQQWAITSDLMDVHVAGHFSYATLFQDIQQYIRHIFQGGPPVGHPEQPYELSYQIQVNKNTPLLTLLVPTLYIAPYTRCTGRLTRQDSTSFSLHVAAADTLAYQQHVWTHTQLNLTAHQAPGAQPTLTLQLASKKQQGPGYPPTENLFVGLDLADNHIVLHHTLDQPTTGSHLNVQGEADWQGNTVRLKLFPNTLLIHNQPWQLHPDHQILLSTKGLQLHNLCFTHALQKITLAGTITQQGFDALRLTCQDVAVSLGNLPITGKVQGTGVIRGPYKRPIVEGDLAVHELCIQHQPIGDLHTQLRWHSDSQQLHIACCLYRIDQKIGDITGLYRPQQTDHPLQLKLQLYHAPIDILSHWVKDVFSPLAGNITGQFQVSGRLACPQITGKGKLTAGRLGVPYLNTTYHVNSNFQCNPKDIQVSSLKITDDQAGKMVLRGEITHQNFQNLYINLSGNGQHMQLSTTAEASPAVYGSGVVHGEMALVGPMQDLKLHAKVTTAAGSKLYIPAIQNQQPGGHPEYIRFLDFKKEHQCLLDDTPSLCSPYKFTLLLQVTLTPDLSIEVPFEGKTPDILAGIGAGNLTLAIGTHQNLHITGTYTFTSGTYQVSMYDVFRRTFQIIPGSQINWHGNPDTGTLAIQASYTQNIALSSLLITPKAQHRSIPNYPVQVVLAVQGTCSLPQISFQVNFPTLPEDPALRTAIADFQAKAAFDKPFLDKQVFSLVVLKMFYPTAGIYVWDTVRRSIGSSIGAFFSQQLSSLAALLDQNLTIEIDVSDIRTLPSQGWENSYIKIFYRLWNNKLQLSSSISPRKHPVDGWEILYQLAEDGSLRARLYSQKAFVTGMSPSNWVGISLLYVKRFNRLQDWYKKKKAALP